MVGRTVSVAELMAEIRKDRIFYDDSGGGVTFSGGEPLMQPVFLLAALEACRSEGIHTAVDTCGFAHPGDLLSVAQQTDLFLYDLKIVNDRLHQQWTGISNSVILDNLRALGRIEANIWLRVPIFPGFNDAHSDLVAAARFAAMVPGVQQVNLLPYHRLGRHKGNGQDPDEGRHEVPAPEPGHLEKIADLFRSFGHVTRIGG
jgi:pyruvate formate lyase activating enzyme